MIKIGELRDVKQCHWEQIGYQYLTILTRGPMVLLTLTGYLGLVKHKTYKTWKIYGKEMT